MEPRGRLVAILAGSLILAVVVWVGRYSPWAVLSEARVKKDEKQAWQQRKSVLQRYADNLNERQQRQETRRDEDLRPKIADKPPFAKAAVDATVFNFGTMSVCETGRHKFTIRNIGQAPLIIRRGPPSPSK
jgi:hypothetical protein